MGPRARQDTSVRSRSTSIGITTSPVSETELALWYSRVYLVRNLRCNVRHSPRLLSGAGDAARRALARERWPAGAFACDRAAVLRNVNRTATSLRAGVYS